jgi:hypothetical protein
MLHVMIDHDSEYPDSHVLAWVNDRAKAVRLDAYPLTAEALADAQRLAEEAEACTPS